MEQFAARLNRTGAVQWRDAVHKVNFFGESTKKSSKLHDLVLFNYGNAVKD